MVRSKAPVARALCTFLWVIVGGAKLTKLSQRLTYCEIGYSGKLTGTDRYVAAQRKLKPLNRVERWMLRDYIVKVRMQREARYQAALKACGGPNGD